MQPLGDVERLCKDTLAVSDHNSNQPFPGKVAMVQGETIFLTPAATPRGSEGESGVRPQKLK